jgi:Ni,Fe-hydrogenase III small subunit/ferredoxin
MFWATRGLRDGVVTSRWPAGDDSYFDDFRAAVALDEDGADPANSVAAAAAACPTEAIAVTPALSLDRGRCIMCGRCVAHAPNTFSWSPGSDVSALRRGALVVGATDESDDALDELQAALSRRVRRLRRSVHIRHVDTGSDGSDEWEVAALTNPVYDVHRLGIFFTASPRHADILLATGIGTAGMVEPVLRTLQAMPGPTVLIAAGADAVSGGVIGGGYTGGTGLAELLPIDVWIPGAPATPFALMHGILLALGRLPRPAPDGHDGRSS